MAAKYYHVSFYLPSVHGATPYPIFIILVRKMWNELIPKHPLHPSNHQGNSSCSTKAQMNTKPEELCIKLHILTAASPVHNVTCFSLCLWSIIFTRVEGCKSILPQNLPKHCISSSLKKAEISKAWSWYRCGGTEYKSGQTVLCLGICNKALLIVLPERVKPATNRKPCRGSYELLLIILAIFIMAAYSRAFWEHHNQSDTVDVCLLSANRGATSYS